MVDMPKHWVDSYAAELRERAELLAAYGDGRGAIACRKHAEEIEQRRAAFESEEISIEEAAEESGYHAESLRQLRRAGSWSGKRGDLPRRPAASIPLLELSSDGDSDSIADAINRNRSIPRRTG